MLTHFTEERGAPARVVVLGAGGFIGRAVRARLADAGIETLGLSSADIDLTTPGAGTALADRLEKDDALLLLSALTPDKGRGPDTLQKNIAMGAAVMEAIGKREPAHVVYLSSDAVYPFAQGLVNEETPAVPADLYGAMHVTREIMMLESGAPAVAVLRPTMVFGRGDPHNSYGPNRLRRMARDKGRITLFGNGEETRDHIYIDDVALLCVETLMRRSRGVLNLATGDSISYMELAQKVAALFDDGIEIDCTPRQNPITYRRFDVTALHKAFPEFRFTGFDDALRACHQAMIAGKD
jgi:nucleoside-diphosphate-sugar epimerase